MKIYYDENMPYAVEFFQGFGDVVPFSGRELGQQDIIEADVLLVRSITQVNRQLIKQSSNLSFVGTATIGVDHIDQQYLNDRNIRFSSAPGCNAVSVAEYVLSALVVLAERYTLSLSELTVGIVGAGNTGTRLAEKLDALGIAYKLCDPIRAKSGVDNRVFHSLDDVLACDVISLHVPLTRSGEHPTFHLLGKEQLNRLSEQQILINACRGEVVDNQALLALKRSGHSLKVVLDVWEGEPDICQQLIPYCDITTAHIAGYSLEGKARGTEMLYQALCQQLGKTVSKSLADFLMPATIPLVTINQQFNDILLNQLVKLVYDVRRDDGIFRQQIERHGFDHIRKTYPARREFSAVTVNMTLKAQSDVWHHLGFQTKYSEE
ncbi:4-phosphoerythronate dehydrogenase [Thalassotalea ganghwensis]